MPSDTTTLGREMLDQALPAPLRGSLPVLDKAGTKQLLGRVAADFPDSYTRVSDTVTRLGGEAAAETGFGAFHLGHLRQSPAAQKRLIQVRQDLRRELAGKDPATLDSRVAGVLQRHQEGMQQEVLAESEQADNPLSRQVVSGARGNPANLSAMRGAPLLYEDYEGKPAGVPVTRSYSQGLTPSQYWAAAYGARAGTVAVKLSTADTGYAAKSLARASHRLVAVEDDDSSAAADDAGAGAVRGLLVDVGDPDNEGSRLARAEGGYAKNTPLTPAILRDLRRRGLDRVLVRSPVAARSPTGGGVFRNDLGLREGGRTPEAGELVGLTASQALSEGLTQAALSAKHSGGIAGEATGKHGFALIDALLNPSATPGQLATHAQADGRVSRVEPSPAGGWLMWVGGKRHYLPTGRRPRLAVGDAVEAGDQLSDGTPSMTQLVAHQGVGEGRRKFVGLVRDAYRGAGLTVHRRNLELLATGLVDHVTLTGEVGEHSPGDTVGYGRLERSWEPRKGAQTLVLSEAAPGAPARYLEEPALHYTIGTRLTPRVRRDLAKAGVAEVLAHPEPPPFRPRMLRAHSALQHDPDWQTRMYGTHLTRSVLDAAARGAASDTTGTSFVPALAEAARFGEWAEGVGRRPDR